ncbi:WD40-repeat-containing domain protein [Fimicolochytrium jonesii]|uniref:WD40-repeat-containing domain protein n=1 Tax=Fimicolochytrium jonesii TaxID=1396493 RepID=UPI0022FDBCA3|nr:WD40-repeat-containing domain protein [Fimicolochytrium jonesii]KAI8823023.1 WD40-repeat-containing domain protein [Fimicolochytrium jonesii]
MSDYRKVQIKRFSKPAGRRTTEATYWKKFKSPILLKEYAAVTSIHFSATRPHDFAVTSSTRVQVYSPSTHAVKKTISRFKDTAYSGNIRSDGKLLVAGDASGLVQLFDLGSRAILRTLRGHDGPVHVARFSPDQMQILSGSDDKTVRVWDVPTEKELAIFTGHEDYVRAAIVSQENPHLVVSSSYDHTVKLWDVRSQECTMTMRHDAPVEALLMFPGSGMLASAGGNQVKLWDIFGGGRHLQTLANHQKTITSMTFDGSGTRLLTGSHDHHVKIYSLRDYKVVHSIKYPAPVQSIGVSPDDTHLVVGMNNGLLSIRQRMVKTADLVNPSKEVARRGTKKFWNRGADYVPEVHDIRIESRRRKKLKVYDKMMRAFRFGDALDAVLAGTPQAVIVVSLMEELYNREDALRAALSGRDDKGLEPILRFLIKQINNPKFSAFLIDVAELIIDMYASVAGHSPLIDDLLRRLRTKVNDEIQIQTRLSEVMGFMATLLSITK